MFLNFLLRLVIDSLTEDSTLLKHLLQTGQKYTSLAEGWMSWKKLLRQSQASLGLLFRLQLSFVLHIHCLYTHILQMDVTDEEDVKAGAKHIENIDGKLDILVNKFVCS